MADATLVRDNSTLAAALERLRGAQRLALDTEFMRESTYHAQLCLVQVATDADDLAVVTQHLDVATHRQLLARPPGIESLGLREVEQVVAQ